MKKENANTKINDNGSTKASPPTGNLKNTSVGADFTSAQNGITLIALVITIIILLILAGVAINMLLGEDGILKTAKFAAEKYENAAEIEKNQLAQVNDTVEGYLTTSRGTNVTYDLMWEGKAIEKNKTYNFIDPQQDISNYDFILIEYTQNDAHRTSTIVSSRTIKKDDSRDNIALWGYSTRYTLIYFVNNGFKLTEMIGDGGCYNYPRTIYGIKFNQN